MEKGDLELGKASSALIRALEIAEVAAWVGRELPTQAGIILTAAAADLAATAVLFLFPHAAAVGERIEWAWDVLSQAQGGE